MRWHPNDFLGSWVLMLAAHSDVLKQFDGGDGTVAIHGRNKLPATPVEVS